MSDFLYAMTLLVLGIIMGGIIEENSHQCDCAALEQE